jgi:hypothetical protein
MTGIEMLEKLVKDIENMKQQVQLMDANLKVLNNRINQLITGSTPIKQGVAQQAISPPISVRPKQEQAAIAAPVLASTPKVQPQQGPSVAIKTGRLIYKRVFGYLKNQQDKPIEEALVLVYNSRNEVCASAVSDPTGLWETMLTPGRYVAEFKKDNFPAVNRAFEFTEFVKDHEVK